MVTPKARLSEACTKYDAERPQWKASCRSFAAQVVPSYQDLGLDLDQVNVNGGAIAVGHPFGMTGARLQNTMINSLSWHDKSTGLITMCVGGGQGMAMILERLSGS